MDVNSVPLVGPLVVSLHLGLPGQIKQKSDERSAFLLKKDIKQPYSKVKGSKKPPDSFVRVLNAKITAMNTVVIIAKSDILNTFLKLDTLRPISIYVV